METFVLDDYSRRGDALLKNVRQIFAKYEDLDLQGIATDKLPENMKPEDGIKLVFVGQYSSGKSSIIKMLTGIETEIGAGIKTQEAHPYTWNDLEIIDTPGIHTEIRPEHDEATYDEIDHAALLIFVVTNEGFDAHMGKHFRKLAIDQNRAKNMVLVVNKMDRTALGNVAEQQKIISEDLKKVITPYAPEDLYLSFLDTDSYFNIENAEDEEEREYYLTQSGREKFITNLNDFVKSRGLLSKIQTPLETLKSAVTAVIGDGSTKQTRDEDIEVLGEILRRKKEAWEYGRRRIKSEIEDIAENCAARIRNEGEIAAGAIAPGTTEEVAKSAIKIAQANADRYVNDCMINIFRRMEEISNEMSEDVIDIDHSSLALMVTANINDNVSVSIENDGNLLNQFPTDHFLKPAIDGICMKPGLARQLALNIPGAGNLNAAGMVKEVGHFFGVKFKPWGAVNLVNGAAKFLGYVGLAITAYQFLKKVFGDDEDKKMRDNIAKAQNEIRAEFNRGANEVKKEIVTASLAKVEEMTAPDILNAEENYKDFISKKERLKEMNKELSAAMDDINLLMNEVQEMAL